MIVKVSGLYPHPSLRAPAHCPSSPLAHSPLNHLWAALLALGKLKDAVVGIGKSSKSDAGPKEGAVGHDRDHLLRPLAQPQPCLYPSLNHCLPVVSVYSCLPRPQRID